MRSRSISKYTQCPPHGVDRCYSLRSSSALWMSGLHAVLLAVPHRHATGRSRRQCRESSLTVDPHPLRRRLLARDHGIRRVRRGCRPSATKPGGEQQAFHRVSGHQISTTLVVGGRLGAPSPFPCRSCRPPIRLGVRFPAAPAESSVRRTLRLQQPAWQAAMLRMRPLTCRLTLWALCQVSLITSSTLLHC